MSAPVDCNALKDRLAEAEAAYHALLIGGKAQTVTFGSGKSVSYTAATIGELRRYINDLKEQIAANCGCPSAGKRSPVRFKF